MMQAKTDTCAALPELENALLWCMRAWVIGYAEHKRVSHRIAAVFNRLGAPGGAEELERFMGLLSRNVRRMVEVNCVCCEQVSADEHLLLDVFALQQQEDHSAAYALMARLINEPAAEAACDHAQRLALALAASGRALAETFPLPIGRMPETTPLYLH